MTGTNFVIINGISINPRFIVRINPIDKEPLRNLVLIDYPDCKAIVYMQDGTKHYSDISVEALTRLFNR